MILLLSCIVYSLLVAKLRFTPVLYFLIWFGKHAMAPLLSLIKKMFRKKSVPQVIEDAFSIPADDNKAVTFAQKMADKGGDDIAKLVTEMGKLFVDVDLRVKVLFGFLITLCFVTGIVMHVRWAIIYWQASLVLITLFIEFVMWTKKTAKPKTEVANV